MTLIDLLNLPTDQLFTNFFLPFILIFAILWGLFSMISIFNRKINIILAIGITILVANTEYFVLLSSTVFQYSGFAGVIVFGVVLIFGIVKWGLYRGKEMDYRMGPSHKKIEKFNKEIAKLQNKMAHEDNPAKKMAYQKTIEEFERKKQIEYASD